MIKSNYKLILIKHLYFELYELSEHSHVTWGLVMVCVREYTSEFQDNICSRHSLKGKALRCLFQKN